MLKDDGEKTTPSGGKAGNKAALSNVESSGRKVRIQEESPAQSVKRRAPKRASIGDGAKADQAAVLADSSAEGQNGAAEHDNAAEPDDGKKFSPKHKDKTVLPEKSLLKKKRKAGEDGDVEEDVASPSAPAAKGKTSNGSALQDEAEDSDEEELDFLAGFESGSGEEDEADSSDEEGDQEPVTVKELPAPKTESAKKQGKGKKQDVRCHPYRRVIIRLICCPRRSSLALSTSAGYHTGSMKTKCDRTLRNSVR